jgi:hypothetical protein
MQHINLSQQILGSIDQDQVNVHVGFVQLYVEVAAINAAGHWPVSLNLRAG